jgi:sugar-specific transcriptional regulator TrmB
VTALTKLVKEALQDFGLTEKESEVYIYLAKSCIQEAKTISKRLSMHKAQVYRILGNLRNKGLVKSTFEVPMRFEAVPFEGFFDLMIKIKKEELSVLEGRRKELLTHWNAINVQCPVFRLGRFMIIEGRNNLFSMTFQMIEKAEKELLIIFDDLGLIQAVKMGLLDPLKKTGTRIRFLTTITKENLQNVKTILQDLMTLNSKFFARHVSLISRNCPRFIIKDDSEAILFLLDEETLETDQQKENGIWTNAPLVFYTKSFFEELWHKSIDAKKMILELETENNR